MATLMGLAATGIAAAQAGLTTTSHNIANANTAGYNRQEILQTNALPIYTPEGFFGQGVGVTTVRRIYSEFLELQARSSQSQAAASAALEDQLSVIDRLLSDPAAGLSPALNDFFAGIQDFAAHPSDTASRESLLGRANALAARFHDLDRQLDDSRRGMNVQVRSSVETINGLSQQIALVNRRIADAINSGNGDHSPSDLLDQRDQLLRALNAEVRAGTTANTDGTVNVFLGNGEPVVVGIRSHDLVVLSDPESPQDEVIGLNAGAAIHRLRDSDLTGGRLGGLLEFRRNDLPEARNALGRIAIAMATDMNAQHRLGIDRNGNVGGDLFSAGTPQVTMSTNNTGSAVLAASIASVSALTTSGYRVTCDGANYQVTRLADGLSFPPGALPQTVDGVVLSIASGSAAAGDVFRIEPTEAGASGFDSLLTNASRLAAGAPIRTASAVGNTGAGRVSAGSVNLPPPPDVNLQQTVTITFTGPGSFDVNGIGTGNPSGLLYAAGSTISYNGWRISIDGAPLAGDVFTIRANNGSSADNRNALLLAGLQNARTLEAGAASYGEAYGGIVSTIGNRTRESQLASEAQQRLADQAEASRDSISGVNLDEEAAKLLRYQQAYQAAGRAFGIADALFQTILDLGR